MICLGSAVFAVNMPRFCHHNDYYTVCHWLGDCLIQFCHINTRCVYRQIGSNYWKA